ncbi:hypothetical protein PS880_04966 [Pseudomonas fluorescens]|uniref:Uncharacterized protein n=1 Tax=Pseudomonas fluorescens TaxID=294 RepID=A0A5E7P447_PSEFL|nr:hypothetical protein PS880_04966 [Pseudomonas fluorescens]
MAKTVRQSGQLNKNTEMSIKPYSPLFSGLYGFFCVYTPAQLASDA